MTVIRDFPEMTDNYQRTCSVRTPQRIVFLLDRGRSMAAAIIVAKEYIEKWLSDKSESPAPIVVNISDGNNLDVSPIESVSSSLKSLRGLPSNDGPALFYSMLINSDVDISAFDKNDSNDRHAFVSNVPNNHCPRYYFSYNPEDYDSTHSPLIGLTTHANELYSIITASAGFGRANRLEWE